MSTMTEEHTQLSEILEFVCKALDIREELYQDAKQSADDLSEWLSADHIRRFQSDAQIYHQGSMRLGTSVRPVREGDEYDVDLVYRREIRKESTTQEQLKHDLGDQLHEYVRHVAQSGEAPPTLKEGLRCWTLKYDGRFHLDILPSLPDDEAAIHNLRDVADGIIITDKDLREWQHSNPKGFANWFNEKQGALIHERQEAIAREANVDVESVPSERVPTPLRRAVQILKRHRDIQYQGSLDDKPASIVITTLAAQAYRYEEDDLSALMAIVPGMRNHIEKRGGIYWVENPINPGENFADRWERKPQRAARFFEWLGKVESDLRAVTQQKGLQKIGASLGSALGEDIVHRALEEYGSTIDNRHQEGRLRMAPKTGLLGAAGTVVKRNTWYGD